MTTSKLTPKRDKFVDEYLIDLNATQAAVRAGYSERTARSQGQRMLTNVDIQEALIQRRQLIQEQLDVTPEKVIAEYAKLAFASMGTYASWGPDGVELKESEELTADDLAAVLEVTETRGDKATTIRFKLHDKKGALDSLAKALGLSIERIIADVNIHDDSAIDKLQRTVATLAARAATDGGSSGPNRRGSRAP